MVPPKVSEVVCSGFGSRMMPVHDSAQYHTVLQNRASQLIYGTKASPTTSVQDVALSASTLYWKKPLCRG
ncbi:hypothetical protein LA080_007418 [Diaporthe eres]|nr:hypothetical protein LA080_007418 [Diaporthe eres]